LVSVDGQRWEAIQPIRIWSIGSKVWKRSWRIHSETTTRFIKKLKRPLQNKKKKPSVSDGFYEFHDGETLQTSSVVSEPNQIQKKKKRWAARQVPTRFWTEHRFHSLLLMARIIANEEPKLNSSLNWRIRHKLNGESFGYCQWKGKHLFGKGITRLITTIR